MRMVGIGFSLLLYSFCTSVFRYFNVSQYPFLKLLLFLASIMLAFIIYQLILARSRKEIAKRLPSHNLNYKIVFQNLKKKRQFHSYFFIVLHCIALFLYMDLKNGTEAGVLVLNGMLAYLFIWIESGVIPLTYAYQQKYVVFKELKKF